METDEFNENSFKVETNNLMEVQDSQVKEEPKVAAKKKPAARNSGRKVASKKATEIVLSSDVEGGDTGGKPTDPDYQPRVRTQSKSKKNA